MTRTLIVSQYFPPEPLGGAHRWKEFVEALPDDDEYRVVCPPPALPYGNFDRSWRPIKREKVGGVSVTRLWTYQPTEDATSSEANLGRILNYGVFSVIASLYVLANAWRYDQVVTVSSPHTTFLPGILAQALGLRWIADIFDLWLDNARDLGFVESDGVLARFVAALERRAIRDADAVVVITRTMSNHFADRYDVSSSRFTIVPFGVDEETFAPRPGPRDTRTVVYIGNLGESHALRPFIEAFVYLEDTSLRIVGTGKRREELEKFCRAEGLTDRVTFEGVVPRDEVPDILAGAEASIVPLKRGHSLDYARPTKLLESMAVGTPFVASALTEIERVAEESGGGFAVENDADVIAEKLDLLVADPQRQAEMGERAVAYIDREHRWSELAERVGLVLGVAEGPDRDGRSELGDSGRPSPTSHGRRDN